MQFATVFKPIFKGYFPAVFRVRQLSGHFAIISNHFWTFSAFSYNFQIISRYVFRHVHIKSIVFLRGARVCWIHFRSRFGLAGSFLLNSNRILHWQKPLLGKSSVEQIFPNTPTFSFKKLSKFWTFVNILKICQHFKNLSTFWKFANILKICQTFENLSEFW